MLAPLRARVAVIGPALGLLALIAFVAQVGIAVMLPLLPLFATELGAEPFVLGLLTSAFAVTNGLGQFGAGLLADRYGARRFISGGMALYASMNALIATAATAAWLVAWRALSGFGGGAVIVAERLYLTEVTEPGRRAFANGILSAAASAGMVAGPAFGGLIAAIGGLRAPFVIVALTSGIALVASLWLPRPSAASRPAEDGLTAATGEAEEMDRGGVIALLVANLAMLAGYGAFITTYAPSGRRSRISPIGPAGARWRWRARCRSRPSEPRSSSACPCSPSSRSRRSPELASPPSTPRGTPSWRTCPGPGRAAVSSASSAPCRTPASSSGRWPPRPCGRRSTSASGCWPARWRSGWPSCRWP
jgi:MFS family permease